MIPIREQLLTLASETLTYHTCQPHGCVRSLVWLVIRAGKWEEICAHPASTQNWLSPAHAASAMDRWKSRLSVASDGAQQAQPKEPALEDDMEIDAGGYRIAFE